MTIDKRETINIPKWIVLILIPLVFGAVGGISTGMYTAGKYSERIEIGIKERSELKIDLKDKADKTDVIRIENALVRIENKVDQNIVYTKNAN